jgi:hypothetical protein
MKRKTKPVRRKVRFAASSRRDGMIVRSAPIKAVR